MRQGRVRQRGALLYLSATSEMEGLEKMGLQKKTLGRITTNDDGSQWLPARAGPLTPCRACPQVVRPGKDPEPSRAVRFAFKGRGRGSEQGGWTPTRLSIYQVCLLSAASVGPIPVCWRKGALSQKKKVAVALTLHTACPCLSPPPPRSQRTTTTAVVVVPCTQHQRQRHLFPHELQPHHLFPPRPLGPSAPARRGAVSAACHHGEVRRLHRQAE